MEKDLDQIYAILQKLVGLHRQLLETVRQEKEALVAADLRSIQETTYAKEALIEAIRQQENERLRAVSGLALKWKRHARDLVLSQIIIAVQGEDPKRAELFRNCLNALTILVQRVMEQNKGNLLLIDRSLEHVTNMKKNVLGERTPHSDVYTQQGQKSVQQNGARLISKEA